MADAANGSFYPDRDLVLYVHHLYGTNMGMKLAEIFGLDPLNASGFANSVRRSVTRDLDEAIQSGRYKP